ncbi:hypothetical protein BJY01DRAFT_253522 [Aspergillus pseudoustus]|uniref:SGNH hydrolase-type esterase domain-containing protein n=1 Tax=Aspergillus pseudoustus TaxID=1810923 RepID=A0ABR4J331_9EURO
MWPEYLATKYNYSLVLGYNLALSGAVVDVDIIPTAPHDVDYQVHEKFEPYSNKANFFPTKTSLFTMWVGNNDVNRSFNGTDPTINTKIIARYEELVRHLYEIGARNFLFLSVPPMWRFPSNTENPDVDLRKLQIAVEDYNRKLKRMAREIDHNLPYSTVYYYDIPPLLNAVIDDPSQFAETAVYKNTTGWCSAYNTNIPRPDYKSSKCEYSAIEYLFIDGAHPTQPFHDLLAKELSVMLANRSSLS